MKKLIVSILMVCAVITAKAQDIRVGMQMSPTISYLSSDGDYMDKVNRIKFSWGFVTVYHQEGRNFSWMSGLDITFRGANLEYIDAEDNIIEAKFNTQHLEIPLSIKMHTREIGYFSYWLKAGVAPSIELKEKVEFTKNGLDYDLEKDGHIENMGMNLILGVGTQYEISEGTDLFFGLAYSNGMFDSFKDLEGYSDAGYFNHFALQVGVLF